MRSPARCFVVLVKGDLRLVDVVMLEQHARRARILAGDVVHAAQGFQRAQGDVAQVADGCRNEIEHRE
jgi:hypothetical protein